MALNIASYGQWFISDALCFDCCGMFIAKKLQKSGEVWHPCGMSGILYLWAISIQLAWYLNQTVKQS